MADSDAWDAGFCRPAFFTCICEMLGALER